MKKIIPLTLATRQWTPRNLRSFVSAVCAFAILIMPFAQMAAATRGNQGSEFRYHQPAKSLKTGDPIEAAPPAGLASVATTLTDNRPSTDPLVASPGDTIHYTAVISNTGGADATGVQFNDDVDANTTVVTSSVKMSPVALADSYNGALNTQLVVAAPGVLTNDTGIPAPTAIVVNPTTRGGSVSMFPDGSFTYTPPNNFAGGDDTFLYVAMNGQSPNATATVTITIPCQTINVTNPGVNTGTVDAPFSQTFTQTGAIGTATFTTASTLPTGLTLSTTGVLSGTPTQSGTFPIVVTVTDSNGCTGTGATYTLTINCQTISVTNPGVTTGTVGAPFSQTFTQAGAHGGATFTTASTLPSGLTLSTAGVLSGAPTQSGSFPIVVTVTDANGCTGTGATYTLTINCQTITVTNPANNSGAVGSPFSETFTQTGAQGGATFTTASTLPSGLTLSSAGVLSGTPTQGGTFPIVVTVTDGNGCTGTGTTYNLTINCQIITVTNPANTSGTAGSPFSETFTQTGAQGTATFTTASTLPSGLTLSSAGVLSGTPTQAGSFPIVVTVTDSNGCTGTGATYNLMINCSGITISPQPTAQTVCAGGTATFTSGATSSPSPTVQWQVDSGSGFNNIPGATSTTLSFAAVAGDNGKQYRAVFDNGCGTANSNAATLTVDTLPVVTTDPTNQTVCEGGTASFTAAATSNANDHTVQWQVEVPAGSFTDIPGATSTTLSFTTTAGQNGNQYRAVFTDSCGSTNTSAATLTVTGPCPDELLATSETLAKTASALVKEQSDAHLRSMSEHLSKTVTGGASGIKALNHGRILKRENRHAEVATTVPLSCSTTTTHVCVDVGTLPAGKSVTITFSVTVNSPYGGGGNVSNQGTVSGSNFSNTSTDDPDTGASNDATLTPICGGSGTVVNTNDSGAGSLRQAILNLCAGGGTIDFDPALTSGGPATITLSSELLLDKNLTINGPTNNGLTISGNNASRVFNVQSGKTALISNLTIANGRASNGGGILNAGTLTIVSSTITNNHTANGVDSSGPGVNGSNGGDGGGIYNTGALKLINSTISGNQPGNGGDASGSDTSGNGGNGGGIFISAGTLTSINTTIANNKTGANGVNTTTSPSPGPFGNAGTGGGIYTSGGTVILRNTIVAGNFSVFQTLGPPRVFANSDDDINGAVDSSSANNLVGIDAGMTGISNGSNGNKVGASGTPLSAKLDPLANNGGPTFTHFPHDGCPVNDAGNNALAKDQNNNDLTTDQRGAGFPRIINGTVEIGAVESTGTPPGAGADLTVTKSVDRDTVIPDRDLTYTIVVSNSGADAATGASLTDTLPSVTTNSDPDSPMYTSTTFVSLTPAGGWVCNTPPVGSGGTVSCTKASVAGSSTQTFTLVVHVPPSAVPNSADSFISNSVSVDDANDTNTENNNGFAVTQLFSCLSTPIVSTSGDSGAGSLRQVIADACDGATITFDMTPGHVTSPITLTSGELLINKNLTITGPGAKLLTISGNNVSRVFEIQASKTAIISGLTIANGKVTAGNSAGGVLNNGTLTLISSAVSGNSAANGAGGISNNGATGTAALTIINCTISGNTAPSFGGGILSSGFQGNATLTIVNSTISGNGNPSFGGGIYNDGNAGTANLNITNSTVSGNTAASSGGGIYNFGNSGSANLTLNNTIVSDNKGPNAANGPDIFNFNGTAAGSNNVIQTSTGFTISGSNNINADPMLEKDGLGNLVLKDNGGPTRTLLLLPTSPAINTGSNANLPADAFDLDGDSNTAESLPVDQRGFARVVGSTVDIGAVETNYAIVATAGSGQNTNVNTAFATALKATVTESGTAQNNIQVTFTAPASGASGTFPGPSTTAVASTNSSGVATAPTFTANATGGSYNVVASIGTATPTSNFALTNNKLNQTITFGSIPNKTFGDADFGVSPTASSSLAVSLAASGNCTVTTPAPGTVHITGAGNCTITASQAGNATFNAATNVQQSFTIAKAATTTAVSATPNPSNSGQNVTFTATVTSGAGTPTGTVQFKDGGTNLGSAQTLNGSGVATFSTTALTPGVHAITADYSGDVNFATSSGTLSGGQQVGSIIRFSSSTYNTTENAGFTTITVQRVGDLSQAVSVDYTTPDDSTATAVLPCSTANGVASPRCDFETTLGTLRWAAGDGASKTFTVLINQDNFVEGPETLTLTLSNLTGAGVLFPTSGTTTATLTITDDVTEPATNPIDDTDTFVRQHYRDFLNRDPDASGLAFWKDNIDKCNDPARRPAGMSVAQCFEVQHINTSAAFFLSIEFQNTGYFVERVYKTAFGDISPPTVPVPVRFTNFITDTQQVGNGVIVGVGSWQAQLDNNKTAYAQAFVQRAAFLSRYPALTSASAFVDALNANAGNVLSDSERAALISELSPNPADPILRADVLKKVADNATLQQREFNRAFVLLEYFGYLRRNPDAAPEPALNFAGYNFWLNKLNLFNGNYIDAEMVKAFLSSAEYRHRFGP